MTSDANADLARAQCDRNGHQCIKAGSGKCNNQQHDGDADDHHGDDPLVLAVDLLAQREHVMQSQRRIDLHGDCAQAMRVRVRAAVRNACAGQPVWINELGYATTPGRSEQQQADWWVRAFATFLGDSAVSHLGIYEIRDLPTDQPVIGDAPNYHLGLLRVDRTPKLAIEGDTTNLHTQTFVRPDGTRITFVWPRKPMSGK